MKITTAKRHYKYVTDFGNNGLVIETRNHLIDLYFTGTFRLSTAYVPADQYSGRCYIAWLGWLHVEITEQTTLEA
jgi:hypothetical protein